MGPGVPGPALLTIPIAVWELSLGLWLVIKGFRPSPLTAEMESSRGIPVHAWQPT